MMARLATHIWVGAYLARLGQENIAAYILHKGDEIAGAVLVKLALLDGRAQIYQRGLNAEGVTEWLVSYEGDEAGADAMIERARAVDRDLWVIELEDRAGRHLLDEAGFKG